jgi:hypothetical protein
MAKAQANGVARAGGVSGGGGNGSGRQRDWRSRLNSARAGYRISALRAFSVCTDAAQQATISNATRNAQRILAALAYGRLSGIAERHGGTAV